MRHRDLPMVGQVTHHSGLTPVYTVDPGLTPV